MYIRYRYWRAWQPIVFLVYLSNHADLAPYHRKQLNIYNSSSHHACISEISVDINLTILKFANVIHAYSNSLKLIENKKKLNEADDTSACCLSCWLGFCVLNGYRWWWLSIYLYFVVICNLSCILEMYSRVASR